MSGGPARLLRASRHDMGCLEVSGGPARPLRASRHDMGCLEVSGGPARLLRASRHDMGWPSGVAQGLQTPPDTPNRVRRLSEVDQGLQTPPDTSRHPNRVWRPQGSRRAVQRRAGAGKGPVGDPRAPGPCRHLGGGIWTAPACWDESRPSQASPNMTWRTPLLHIPLYKRFAFLS